MLASLVAGPARTHATVLVELPLDDLIASADAIVMGEVVSVGTRLQMRQRRVEPWTATVVRVDRAWGHPVGRHVVVEERGGLWQGGGMRIAGTPEYRPSERVVLMLRLDPEGRWRTWGMAQGRFVVRAAVDGPTWVERDLSDAAFAHWSNGRMQLRHLPPTSMPLADLLERIERIRAIVSGGNAP